MIRQRRTNKAYIDDMIMAIENILAFSKGLNFQEFVSNKMAHDAIIRNFEILGEGVKRIPFKFQKQHKHIPWQHMYGLRNFIVHEYFDLDEEIIWEIIQNDLEKNYKDLKAICFK
jgi:uncharacterized protein with HEPN domain